MTPRLLVLAVIATPLGFAAPDPSTLTFNREALKLPPLTLSDLIAKPAPSLSFAAPGLPVAPQITPPRPTPRGPRTTQLPIVEPDPSVDYKMVIVPPNPEIDFKMAVKVPVTPEPKEPAAAKSAP